MRFIITILMKYTFISGFAYNLEKARALHDGKTWTLSVYSIRNKNKSKIT